MDRKKLLPLAIFSSLTLLLSNLPSYADNAALKTSSSAPDIVQTSASEDSSWDKKTCENSEHVAQISSMLSSGSPWLYPSKAVSQQPEFLKFVQEPVLTLVHVYAVEHVRNKQKVYLVCVKAMHPKLIKDKNQQNALLTKLGMTGPLHTPYYVHINYEVNPTQFVKADQKQLKQEFLQALNYKVPHIKSLKLPNGTIATNVQPFQFSDDSINDETWDEINRKVLEPLKREIVADTVTKKAPTANDKKLTHS